MNGFNEARTRTEILGRINMSFSWLLLLILLLFAYGKYLFYENVYMTEVDSGREPGLLGVMAVCLLLLELF